MTRKTICLLFAAVFAACSPTSEPPQTRLSMDQFIAVMVELQTVQPAERATVLQKHRTSETELKNFVAAWSEQPRLLGMAFDSIQSKVDETRFKQE